MKTGMKAVLGGAASLALTACATTAVADSPDIQAGITEADVIAAQTEWGEGIVAIASVHTQGGDYSSRATEHINSLYAYGDTDVMFKPTLAADDQFRETFEEALSYFIGAEGTEDSGFAIKGWTDVRWESNGISTSADTAMAMGNYYFTGPDGNETKVEYTFGYVLDDAGDLKINLHHSSLPFAPAVSITEADVIAAQTEWGEGIVAISSVHSAGGDYKARATEHINTLYAYDDTAVMFKPTLAAEDQFRETFDEALSYFIGTEGSEDSGFAIKGWTNVRWESNGIYTDGDSATAMGNYYFTGPDGSETKVEYTFGYVLDEAGDLKINLHHSSLPYSAG